MVTKRCRQRNLHEMSYTIKYKVKTRMATGVAVSTERVKYDSLFGHAVHRPYAMIYFVSFQRILYHFEGSVEELEDLLLRDGDVPFKPSQRVGLLEPFDGVAVHPQIEGVLAHVQAILGRQA